ncbi:MAG TPA: GDP-mannose 4,6-dehydratase, partial [Saprospiraceae bacterium]|nr:GDP-mannose 4,6-dehydratase [Saprospiraceae bacterium]
VAAAFKAAKLDITWIRGALMRGDEVFERGGLIGYNHVIIIDPNLYRPAEVNHLEADYSKAKQVFGWEPTTSFENLVQIMVDADIKRFSNDIPH